MAEAKAKVHVSSTSDRTGSVSCHPMKSSKGKSLVKGATSVKSSTTLEAVDVDRATLL